MGRGWCRVVPSEELYTREPKALWTQEESKVDGVSDDEESEETTTKEWKGRLQPISVDWSIVPVSQYLDWITARNAY